MRGQQMLRQAPSAPWRGRMRWEGKGKRVGRQDGEEVSELAASRSPLLGAGSAAKAEHRGKGCSGRGFCLFGMWGSLRGIPAVNICVGSPEGCMARSGRVLLGTTSKGSFREEMRCPCSGERITRLALSFELARTRRNELRASVPQGTDQHNYS